MKFVSLNASPHLTLLCKAHQLKTSIMVMAYTPTCSTAPKALRLQLVIQVHIAHSSCRKPGDLSGSIELQSVHVASP